MNCQLAKVAIGNAPKNINIVYIKDTVPENIMLMIGLCSKFLFSKIKTGSKIRQVEFFFKFCIIKFELLF